MKHNIVRFVALLCLLPFSGLVMAHAGNHDATGFISGIAHVITGADHMIAMFAIGLWIAISARHRQAFPVVSVLTVMVLGVLLGISGFGVPAVETGIATSVLVMGLLVGAFAQLPVTVVIAMVSVFALFHGVAHGSEMSINASPIFYCLGLLASTSLILITGAGLVRMIKSSQAKLMLRGVGLMTGGFGVWLLLSA